MAMKPTEWRRGDLSGHSGGNVTQEGGWGVTSEDRLPARLAWTGPPSARARSEVAPRPSAVWREDRAAATGGKLGLVLPAGQPGVRSPGQAGLPETPYLGGRLGRPASGPGEGWLPSGRCVLAEDWPLSQGGALPLHLSRWNCPHRDSSGPWRQGNGGPSSPQRPDTGSGLCSGRLVGSRGPAPGDLHHGHRMATAWPA